MDKGNAKKVHRYKYMYRTVMNASWHQWSIKPAVLNYGFSRVCKGFSEQFPRRHFLELDAMPLGGGCQMNVLGDGQYY